MRDGVPIRQNPNEGLKHMQGSACIVSCAPIRQHPNEGLKQLTCSWSCKMPTGADQAEPERGIETPDTVPFLADAVPIRQNPNEGLKLALYAPPLSDSCADQAEPERGIETPSSRATVANAHRAPIRQNPNEEGRTYQKLSKWAARNDLLTMGGAAHK